LDTEQTNIIETIIYNGLYYLYNIQKEGGFVSKKQLFELFINIYNIIIYLYENNLFYINFFVKTFMYFMFDICKIFEIVSHVEELGFDFSMTKDDTTIANYNYAQSLDVYLYTNIINVNNIDIIEASPDSVIDEHMEYILDGCSIRVQFMHAVYRGILNRKMRI